MMKTAPAKPAPAVRFGLLALALLAWATAACAAETAKRNFDLPAGPAGETLKQFATQAGREIVFASEAIGTVPTKAVKGEFAPRKALDLMLAESGLVATQDPKTGAFAVRKGTADPNGSRAATATAADRPANPEAAAPTPASANSGGAAQPAGAVTGRVRNVVTEQYLKMAKVSLVGTNRTVYTDSFGVFQLPDVPAGPVVLEVFYTDLDLARIAVTVPAGGTVEQAIDLTSVSRYGGAAGTVRLDPYVISSDRETDAQAIAVNEQRFAANIKNVMSTDSLGDVLGSSVGEFLKFIPGITAVYDLNDISGISVRGIGSGMTTVSVDGVPSTSSMGAMQRSADLRSMALNDVARIEVTKVPTPSSPADSLGGSVNMVGKSAFDRSGRELRYGINVVGNSENLTLHRTPHPYLDRNTFKILPGVDFDFTWPVTKNLGLVIAGMRTTVFNEQHVTINTWNSIGTGTNAVNASPTNPFLQSFLLVDGPRNLIRNSLSVKMDWKVTPHSVLSLGQVANRTNTELSGLNLTFNVGTNGTPTPATGEPMTWGPNFTRSATGRGSITNNGTNQLYNQISDITNLSYRYDDGRWKLETGLSRSWSGAKKRYDDVGTFYQWSAINNRPIRINLLSLTPDKPGSIEVFDNNNQVFDWHDLANYRGNTANIFNGPGPKGTWSVRNQNVNGFLNLGRRFDFLPFPTMLQAGGLQQIRMSDATRYQVNYTFNGPDGVSGATAPLAPYTMQVYKNMDSGFGFSNVPWMSPTRAWEAWQRSPLLFSPTVTQLFNAENYRIDNSEYIRETVRAAYVQAESNLLRNRLRILAGVRFEKTTDEGQGGFTDADAVWQRDANGNFLRTATGARIRKPEAGAVNSVEQLKLTRRERGARSQRTYDGYYPSLHLTYNPEGNLLVRAAYARTYGRPDFADIVPRIVATAADLREDETPDPLVGRGTLTVRNSALKPWTADNFDLSFEYYTPQGGLLSAGVFLKDIKDFFGSSAKIATAADLAALNFDARYIGWNLVTKFNAGDAQIKGIEFNVRHSLRSLGRWGGYFTLFANATKLDLVGNQGASFSSFVAESGNWGATFSRNRLTITARWNYRGRDPISPVAGFGTDGYMYMKERTVLDLNGAYQLTRRLSLNAGVNNVTNESQAYLRYGSTTPGYARQYQMIKLGYSLALGLKGTF